MAFNGLNNPGLPFGGSTPSQTFSRSSGLSYSESSNSNSITSGVGFRGNAPPAIEKTFNGVYMGTPNLPFFEDRPKTFPMIVTFIVLTRDSWALQVVAPLIETTEITFKFDSYEFLPTLAEILPERTAPKLLQARRLQGSGAMSRKGLGLYFTVDSLNSVGGQSYILNQLIQLAESVRTTLVFDAIQKIVTTIPYVIERENASGINTFRHMEDRIEWEVNTWDMAKKNQKSALGDIDTLVKDRVERYGPDEMNVWIVDSRVMTQIALYAKEARSYSESGQSSEALISGGVAGVRGPRNSTVYTVQPMELEENGEEALNLNPLQTNEQIGEYGIIIDVNRGKYDQCPNYTSALRAVQIFDGPSDGFARITMQDALQNQTRFDKATGLSIPLDSNLLRFNGMEHTDAETVTETDKARDPFHYPCHRTKKYEAADYFGQLDISDPVTGRVGSIAFEDYRDMAYSSAHAMKDYTPTYLPSTTKNGSWEEVVLGVDRAEQTLKELAKIPWSDACDLFVMDAIAEWAEGPYGEVTRTGSARTGGDNDGNGSNSLEEILEITRDEVGFMTIPKGKSADGSNKPWFGKLKMPPFSHTMGGLAAIHRAMGELAGKTVEKVYGFNSELFKKAAEAYLVLKFVSERLDTFAPGSVFLNPEGCPSWFTPSTAAAYVANLFNVGNSPIFVNLNQIKKFDAANEVKDPADEVGGTDEENKAAKLSNQTKTAEVLAQRSGEFAQQVNSKLKTLGLSASDLPVEKLLKQLGEPVLYDSTKIKTKEQFVEYVEQTTRRGIVAYVMMRLLAIIPSGKTTMPEPTRLLVLVAAIGSIFAPYFEGGKLIPGNQNSFKDLTYATNIVQHFYTTEASTPFTSKRSNAPPVLEELLENITKLVAASEQAIMEINEHYSDEASLMASAGETYEKLKSTPDAYWVRTPFCYSPYQFGSLCDRHNKDRRNSKALLQVAPSTPSNPSQITTLTDLVAFGAHAMSEIASRNSDARHPIKQRGFPAGLIGAHLHPSRSEVTHTEVFKTIQRKKSEQSVPMDYDSDTEDQQDNRYHSYNDSGRRGDYGDLDTNTMRENTRKRIGTEIDGPEMASHKRMAFLEGRSSSDREPSHSGRDLGRQRPIRKTAVANLFAVQHELDLNWDLDSQGNFETTYSVIAKNSKTAFVRSVAQVFASTPFTLDSLRCFDTNNIAIPVNVLIMRPHMEFTTTQLTKTASGGVAAETPYGRPTYMEGQDSKIQTKNGTFFWYSTTIIKNERLFFHVKNFMIHKTISGAGTAPFNLNTYAPELDQYGGGSLFFHIVPKTFEKPPSHTPKGLISITGNLFHIRGYGYGDTTIDKPHFPGDDHFARAWGVRDKGLGKTAFGSGNYTQTQKRPNVICLEMHVQYPNQNGEFLLYKPGKGHYDSNYTYQGSQKGKNGYTSLDKKDWSVGYQQI